MLSELCAVSLIFSFENIPDIFEGKIGEINDMILQVISKEKNFLLNLSVRT